MKYILIPLIIFIIYSCSNPNFERYYYSNGQIQFEYSLRNGEHDGPYKAFYKDGSIRAIGNHQNGKFHGEFISFLENGDTADIDLFKNGRVIEKTVFWWYDECTDKYYFVSKEGFQMIKDGKEIKYDKMPDNITGFRYVNGIEENYIWKNGERVKIECTNYY